MSTVVLAIAGALLFLVVGTSLYLLSRWSEREAAFEPEQLSEEEASVYRLGIALGANQGFTFGG